MYHDNPIEVSGPRRKPSALNGCFRRNEREIPRARPSAKLFGSRRLRLRACSLRPFRRLITPVRIKVISGGEKGVEERVRRAHLMDASPKLVEKLPSSVDPLRINHPVGFACEANDRARW